MALCSAAGFGFMPLFASWWTGGVEGARGGGTIALLFTRFTIAGVILLIVCALTGRRLPPMRGPGGVEGRRTLRILVLMGGVLYVAEALSYFKAIDAGAAPGLVALLLYLYPAMVALGAWILLREPMGPRRWLAVVLAMGGAGLAVAAPIEAAPALGVTLGVVCAVVYAAYILIGAKLPEALDPLVSSAVVIVSAAVVFGVLTLATGSRFPAHAMGWIGALGLALVSTVMSLTLFLAALKSIGPVRVSIISTFEAVTAVAVSALWLGARFSAIQLVGGALILIAAIIGARPARRSGEDQANEIGGGRVV